MNWTTPDQTQFKLDWLQFTQLLDQLNATDWWVVGLGILAQFVAVGVAAWSAYYFQIKFKQSEQNIERQKETYRFNEAVAYVAVLVENIQAHLDLLLNTFFSEKKEYSRLCHLIEQLNRKQIVSIPLLDHSFISIQSFEISEPENVISKIPNVGKYVEINRAFYRMQNAMLQFNAISKERNSLIKEITFNRLSAQNPHTIHINMVRYLIELQNYCGVGKQCLMQHFLLRRT